MRLSIQVLPKERDFLAETTLQPEPGCRCCWINSISTVITNFTNPPLHVSYLGFHPKCARNSRVDDFRNETILFFLFRLIICYPPRPTSGEANLHNFLLMLMLSRKEKKKKKWKIRPLCKIVASSHPKHCCRHALKRGQDAAKWRKKNIPRRGGKRERREIHNVIEILSVIQLRERRRG